MPSWSLLMQAMWKAGGTDSRSTGFFWMRPVPPVAWCAAIPISNCCAGKRILTALALQQQRLLEALWPLLASGGILLYVTCSVFRQENSDSVRQFLRDNPDAAEMMPEVDWGYPQQVGWQLLPGEHGMDGFYYARLVKA